MRNILFFSTFAGVLLLTSATKNVNKCDEEGVYDDSDVSISDCAEPPCKLVKGKTVSVVMNFKSEKDYEKVINNVTARIMNTDFPYVGVDGVNACNKIFKQDGSQASCPLKADEDYVYKNELKVSKMFPLVSTVVTWALNDNEGNKVFCFKVKAEIVAH